MENQGLAWGIAWGLLAGAALAVVFDNWLLPGVGMMLGILIGMMVDRRGSS
ncbi:MULTISPECIES: hypothetical protein [Pseudonocardia]|uniref:Glycine zipper family protein n=2 Tax=Pseudonocardia TaxID=1847 RepID=A0A1Y2N1A3_PSEAH|nr:MULTISPECIES: hypothetical protein [Pseudonocardia]OSY41243.1 hypothetical protein BG845_02145 [Pseudonocardia autotrophica]TDN76698.1 hypothetical protein C8E95_5915 [Pseudonocardia autotrophica]BBG00700.1 hypothetical protein Pdca_19090 [Pseudonocardia autotrophica]GEC24334.1 hypothetical protein PSA01_13630 [Pseudonocardia saturnea]